MIYDCQSTISAALSECQVSAKASAKASTKASARRLLAVAYLLDFSLPEGTAACKQQQQHSSTTGEPSLINNRQRNLSNNCNFLGPRSIRDSIIMDWQ